ncbi:MAG: hypothetical protein WDZ56_00035 [Candidatus Paceibacterota bacterium]
MNHFESVGGGQKPESEPRISSEVQISLMEKWAKTEGKTYASNNDLVTAWIESKNAERFRAYLEHGGEIHEDDNLDELLLRITKETLH